MPDLTNEDFRARVEAVKDLTALFRIERMVHLGASVAAFILLFVTACLLMLQKGGASPALLTLLFGASGVIGYTASRLLLMWTKAMDLVLKGKSE